MCRKIGCTSSAPRIGPCLLLTPKQTARNADNKNAVKIGFQSAINCTSSHWPLESRAVVAHLPRSFRPEDTDSASRNVNRATLEAELLRTTVHIGDVSPQSTRMTRRSCAH